VSICGGFEGDCLCILGSQRGVGEIHIALESLIRSFLSTFFFTIFRDRML
jgi:hypothetical protein